MSVYISNLANEVTEAKLDCRSAEFLSVKGIPLSPQSQTVREHSNISVKESNYCLCR